MDGKYKVVKYKADSFDLIWKDNMSKEDADNLAAFLNIESKKQFAHLGVKFVVEDMMTYDN